MSEEDHPGGKIGEILFGILALGLPGILLILILVSGVGLLAGFALWSIVGLVSKWFVPLIFLVAGIIALYELAPRGTKLALVGVGVLIGSVVIGVVLYSGAFQGPQNSYNLLLSLAPNQSSTIVAPSASIFVWSGILIALALSAYGAHRLHLGLEE